jgi:heme exporter protein C
VLGALAVLGVVATLIMALGVTPPDAIQGDVFRLIYVHVPAAWLAYLSFGVTAICSAMYLWRRTRSITWDRLGGASAEIGVLFTGICLVSGMLWGKISWGVYWTWDARLTSTALLFVMFCGYLAVRRLPASPEVRARRCAIVGLVAFVDVPIVHESVQWWRTLHQKQTIKGLHADMQGTMLFTLFFGFVVFTIAYVWLMQHRWRIEIMEDALDEKGLQLAIEERRSELGELGATT